MAITPVSIRAIAGWVNVVVVPFTQKPVVSAVAWPVGVVSSDEPDTV